MIIHVATERHDVVEIRRRVHGASISYAIGDAGTGQLTASFCSALKVVLPPTDGVSLRDGSIRVKTDCGTWSAREAHALALDLARKDLTDRLPHLVDHADCHEGEISAASRTLCAVLGLLYDVEVPSEKIDAVEFELRCCTFCRFSQPVTIRQSLSGYVYVALVG